jgi:hypothetical protein
LVRGGSSASGTDASGNAGRGAASSTIRLSPRAVSGAAKANRREYSSTSPAILAAAGVPLGLDASPVLRNDYTWRVGTAAAYREVRGLTDPEQAVSFGPHPGPELEALRKDTFWALEIGDERAEIRAMSQGELEAHVLEGDRTTGHDKSAACDRASRGQCVAAVGRRRRRARPGARRERQVAAARWLLLPRPGRGCHPADPVEIWCSEEDSSPSLERCDYTTPVPYRGQMHRRQ